MSATKKVIGVENLSAVGREVHLAIGMFDGVHLGHQAVIEAALHSARGRNALAGVLTFWPHPSAIICPENPVPQMMDPPLKDRAMSRLGVDVIIEQPFTPEFASIAVEEFMPWLKRHIPRLAVVYVGENWRFGKGRAGDVMLLVRQARRLGVSVVSMPRIHHNGEPVSSTRIRGCLAAGDLATANALLGYACFSAGCVRPGRGLGRKIGFPTLNLPWTSSLKLRFGVYAVRVRQDGEEAAATTFPGVANYGVRPTIEEHATEPLSEVHLLADGSPFSVGDLLLVEWIDFLRPERKFDGIDELRAQIVRDCEAARCALNQSGQG